MAFPQKMEQKKKVLHFAINCWGEIGMLAASSISLTSGKHVVVSWPLERGAVIQAIGRLESVDVEKVRQL